MALWKRLLPLVLACLMLSGCTGELPRQKTQYKATFLDLFDTVTTVVGMADSQEAFTETAQTVYDQLEIYHQLFDIYNDYEGISNLKTVNDNAGIAPVTVDPILIDLMQDCMAYHDLTAGLVNPAMGSVLLLWHQARNDGINDPMNARLPEESALKAAAEHMDFANVVIDQEASTIYLSDPEMRLDLGAVAKGWAVQRVCESLPEGLLLSVGGNVCPTGPKDEAGTPWVVGIQDPDGGDKYLRTLYTTRNSVVTSGDYQRNYMVDGKSYHHIIDPATLFPSSYWRSVTILCPDSGLADALSTALFLLPQAEGQALLDRCEAEAMWVAQDGSITYSPGFEEFIRT